MTRAAEHQSKWALSLYTGLQSRWFIKPIYFVARVPPCLICSYFVVYLKLFIQALHDISSIERPRKYTASYFKTVNLWLFHQFEW